VAAQSGAAQPAAAQPAAAATPAGLPDERPWWESDPRFASRFQAVDDSSD
jgi:hypothetical protein